MKKRLSKIIPWDRKTVGFFFFGVGVTMFILNLTAVINAINLIANYGVNVKIPLGGYYTSLISSVLLMTYSLYNIYIDKN